MTSLTPLQRIALGKLAGKWLHSQAQIDAHPAGWQEADVAAVKQWLKAQGLREVKTGTLESVKSGCFEITECTTRADMRLAHEAEAERVPLTQRERDDMASGKWEQDFQVLLKRLRQGMQQDPDGLSRGLGELSESVKNDPRRFYQIRLHPNDLDRLSKIPGCEAFFTGPVAQQRKGV